MFLYWLDIIIYTISTFSLFNIFKQLSLSILKGFQ